jgi:hypothetical protein
LPIKDFTIGVFEMRFFIIFMKLVLGSFLGNIMFLALISADVVRAEPVYRGNSDYWTEPVIISETVPIRVDEMAMPYDFPYEPQIIERRIISTRIVSPTTNTSTSNSEIKTVNNKPLSPLRSTEEPVEKSEKKVLPEAKPKTELSESSGISKDSVTSTVVSEPSTEMVVEEPPFSEITFPPVQKESEQISVQKMPQPEPERPAPVSSPTIRGQSSGIASETKEILEERPAHPQGLADISTIDSKLIAENEETLENNNTPTQITENNSAAISEENKHKNENQANGVNGVLLLATIISLAMLIYAVIIAFDYHQRWMQSLTTQNRRFSSLTDDEMDMEVDLSGTIPLYSGHANVQALSRFQSESQYY